MVFVLTEEQKQQLESRGISVIKFKKMCYWLKDVFSNIWDAVKNNPELLAELSKTDERN